jgi:hypothetical protein
VDRVTTLDVFDALDALIDLAQAAAVPAGLLEGVGVAYAYEPNLGLRSLYGGFVSFDNEDATAEQGVLGRETATIPLYARAVNRPPTDVRDTDAAVKTIRVGLQALLKANPKIGGVWSFEGITGGRRTYSRTDDETISELALQVRLGTYASW